MRRGGPSFETIRSEGALLPPDLLQRIAERDKDLDGIRGEDYGLPPNEPLNEAIVRSYNRMLGAWGSFQEARAKLPEGDPGTSITRDRFLLVLLHELGYGRVETEHAIEIEGRSYAVSHAWRKVPIHLLGCNVPLGTRSKGVAGASSQSPHGTLQELLNRSEDRLWGIVSNGLELRLLRDNSSLTRQAFVSFDLEQMLEGDVYSDFALLWMLCHASRLEGERPHECWLERWSQEAEKQGTRALEGLRTGVEKAISALGSGFLRPGRNAELKGALRAGELSAQDYYRELLRLVYRLLFLFVAEDRKLLHDPGASEEAKERYTEWYSSASLRRLAERRRGTKHGDLWQGLGLVMRSLGKDKGEPALGLPALGSFLWSDEAIPHLQSASLPNAALLEAVRSLATMNDGRVLRSVDYKNLGAEELGSVYESLLELHPELDLDAGTFTLTTAAGNERKTSGSYYTPTSLITELLDSALDPVLKEAAARGEEAILDLKVVDPACGSGHFLVAAAHRIAKHLASVRTGDEEPSPEATRHALRGVVSRCIYGVDLNPMAVELCKVSLWMEALDPGQPLSFLDAHIKRGNSLLGTTPALVAGGIPDGAFKPLEGDDKAVATELRKRNRREQVGQLMLEEEIARVELELRDRALGVERSSDTSPDGLRAKEESYRRLVESPPYERARLLADAWCAAFVQLKQAGTPQITQATLRLATEAPERLPQETRAAIEALRKEYAFFQWHVEFPQVFRMPEADEEPENDETGWSGGFDCVLGNPPWDRIQLEEKQFFASLDPEIASASARRRKQLIKSLCERDAVTFALYDSKRREIAQQSHLIRMSGRYPLSGQGNLTTNSLFIELSASLIDEQGRAGLIVPSGIATQDNQKELFAALVRANRIVSLFEFENRQGLFPDVDSRFRFCVFTYTGATGTTRRSEYAFMLHSPADLADDERHFSMDANDLGLFSPNTLSCPAFQSKRDARIATAVYETCEIILREQPRHSAWGWQSWQMMNETHEANELRAWDPDWRSRHLLRVYEAKLIHQFDHRYATYVERADGWDTEPFSPPAKRDPNREVSTRYCVRQSMWPERVETRAGEDQGWALAYRITARATDERTAIFCILPAAGATSGMPLALTTESAKRVLLLLANVNSFVFDYIARLRVPAANLNHFIVHQLPVLTPAHYMEGIATGWRCLIERAVLELTYTAYDLNAFARDCGYAGEPFIANDERRVVLRAELDAMFFHLYGLERDDVNYVMDTFPIVRHHDVKACGEYRTKRVILEIYDEMAQSIETGEPYQTRLDPPPADPRVAHILQPSVESASG